MNEKEFIDNFSSPLRPLSKNKLKGTLLSDEILKAVYGLIPSEQDSNFFYNPNLFFNFGLFRRKYCAYYQFMSIVVTTPNTEVVPYRLFFDKKIFYIHELDNIINALKEIKE